MNNKTKKNRNIYGGATTDTTDTIKKLCIYNTSRISTDPNVDPNYKKIGIVHYSDSAGINIVRGFGTGIANVFGSKGFDNKIYDTLRKSTLDKIKGLLTDTQIICSCRMEFDTASPSMIFHHFYGTLYEKNKIL